MFPDLVVQMKHNAKELPRSQSIVVKQIDDADGSFVIYHFINMFLRNSNGNVFIFATKHSRSHYISVSSKLGLQMNKFMEQKRCKVFELMSNCLTVEEAEKETKTSNDDLSINLTKIMNLVTNELDGFVSADKPFLFIIDDASVLLDLDDSFKKVFGFIQHFRRLTLKNDGLFVVETCFYTNFDLDHQQNCLSSTLAHYANWLLTVKPLTTGWSKDVHGEIWVQEIDKKSFHSDTVKLLFRLSDRNVTFTAPGLIPGVGI